MAVVPGDSRRRGGAASEIDRMRVVELLRSHAEDGHLSSRELDERMELAFRARTLRDLDAASAGLSGHSRATAAAINAHGLSMERPVRTKGSYVERQVLWCVLLLGIGLGVCALTGAKPVWYALTVVFSLIGFTWRVAAGYSRRKGAAGGGPTRRS